MKPIWLTCEHCGSLLGFAWGPWTSALMAEAYEARQDHLYTCLAVAVPASLAQEHGAFRWERVRHRWASKHEGIAAGGRPIQHPKVAL